MLLFRYLQTALFVVVYIPYVMQPPPKLEFIKKKKKKWTMIKI